MLKIKKTFNIHCQLGLLGLIGLNSLSVQAEEMGPHAPAAYQTPALYSETNDHTGRAAAEKSQKNQKQERKRMHQKNHN